MLKKGGVLWTIWNVLVAVAFITFGIVACINSGDTNFQNVIILIIAIFIMIDATVRLFSSAILIFSPAKGAVAVSTNIPAIVGGSSELTVGILLILVSQGLSSSLVVLFQYISYFVGILLLVFGGVAIIYGVLFLVFRRGGIARNILVLICGAILITLGILVFVFFDIDRITQVFFIIFGVLLILVGIALVIGIAMALIANRELAKAAKREAEAAANNEAAPVEEAPVAEEPAQEESAPEAEAPEVPSEDK